MERISAIVHKHGKDVRNCMYTIMERTPASVYQYGEAVCICITLWRE
jgi:hypothetical protein